MSRGNYWSRPLDGGEVDAVTSPADARRHAAKLGGILDRVANRLIHWMDEPENDGILPPKDWTELFRYHQAAVIGFLKEERERAKHSASERKRMTPEQLEAALRKELARSARQFTADEWKLIDEARAAHEGKMADPNAS